MKKKIELVCNNHNESIEISQELYEFLQDHAIIKQANRTLAGHYSLVTTETVK